MATITYTATNPDGITQTRSSGTMAYTHAVSVMREDGKGWGIYSWHKSYSAAMKASNSGYAAKLYPSRRIVEAVPTAINGKAQVGDFAGHPSAAAIDALIEAKAAGKGNQTPKDARPQGGNADNARVAKGEGRPVGTNVMTTLPVERVSAPRLGVLEAVNAAIAAQSVEDPEAAKRARWAANKRASRARRLAQVVVA